MATELHLTEYHVYLLADDEPHTLTVYATSKRQAGLNARNTAKRLLDAKTFQIKRVVATKYKPIA